MCAGTKEIVQPVLYVLSCADGTLYTGITTNLDRRIKEHNSSTTRGAKYTRSRRPVTLVYSEECETKSAALKREFEVKQMTHPEKLTLVE